MKTVPAVAEIEAVLELSLLFWAILSCKFKHIKKYHVFIYWPILDYYKNNADFWATSSQAWLPQMHKIHHQAWVARNFLKPSCCFHEGNSFYLRWIGNFSKIKSAICIITARLGSKICSSDFIMLKDYYKTRSVKKQANPWFLSITKKLSLSQSNLFKSCPVLSTGLSI